MINYNQKDTFTVETIYIEDELRQEFEQSEERTQEEMDNYEEWLLATY